MLIQFGSERRQSCIAEGRARHRSLHPAHSFAQRADPRRAGSLSLAPPHRERVRTPKDQHRIHPRYDHAPHLLLGHLRRSHRHLLAPTMKTEPGSLTYYAVHQRRVQAGFGAARSLSGQLS